MPLFALPVVCYQMHRLAVRSGGLAISATSGLALSVPSLRILLDYMATDERLSSLRLEMLVRPVVASFTTEVA
jgi:hypothetical protein